MSTATRIFIAYGTVILLIAFLLGTVLAALRMKAPDIRSLATAHVETLMQSAMCFGLGFAVAAVGFHSTAATWGAWLVVVGLAMQATASTLNWATKTKDQFAERSIGFKFNSASSLVIWPGLIITGVGILTNL